MTNSIVSNNAATPPFFGSGGGIHNSRILTLTGSVISSNTAVFGGGILNAGIMTAINSTITDNTVNRDGGGILNRGTLILANSTVGGNNGGEGGAIRNEGTLNLTNSTVSDNAAVSDGGGIYNDVESTLILTNNTISGNTATGSSGGIFNNLGSVELTSTIIARNTSNPGPNCLGSLSSQGYNLVGNNSGCGFTATTGDLVGTAGSSIDPLLGPLQDNGGPTFTHALLPGSPAIDSGDDSVLGPPHNLTTDQRGFPRLQGTRVDIGAYEAEPPQSGTITITKTGDTNDGFCGVLDCSLREAIASGDSGDSITIPAGTYTLTLGSELTIDKSLTLTGDGADSTIIQAAAMPGDATHRVFLTTGDGNVVISDVTIQHGVASGDHGGGIYNDRGSLNLINCTLNGNKSTGNGGGIFNRSGTLLVTSTDISNNRACHGLGGTCTFSDGGGVYNDRGSLNLTNSTLSGNGGTNGGAIFNLAGTLMVAGSTISGNFAAQGGGFYSTRWGTLLVDSTTISGNSAAHGGGIYSTAQSTLVLTNSTVIGHSVRGKGGGIFDGSGLLTGTLIITNSVVSDNSAGTGGGIYSVEGDVSVTSSTVSNNTAGLDGGGIFSRRSDVSVTSSTVSNNIAGLDGGGVSSGSGKFFQLTIINSTISGNTATREGGAIYTFYDFVLRGGILTMINSTVSDNSSGIINDNDGGEVKLANTIIVNSNGDDCSGDETFTSLGHNLDSDGSCGLNATGDLSNTNPKLGPLADNGGPTKTHGLLPGSPAIDRIPPQSCIVTTDQRGVARPQGAACDIGAYEFEGVPGDANADGMVDEEDLIIVLGAYGTSPPSDLRADLNGDGVVDILDLVIVAVNFGAGIA